MKQILQFLQTLFTKGYKVAIEEYDFENTAVSLDEMVFEKKEKRYGAYFLRKNYPWHLVTALALGTGLFLYVCFLPPWMGWVETDHWDNSEMLPEWDFELPPPPPVRIISCTLININSQKISKPTPASELLEEKAKEDYLNRIDSFFNGETKNGDPDSTKADKEPDIDDFIFADEEPVPINFGEIFRLIYPISKDLRSKLIEGKVVARILIDKEGNYRKHTVLYESQPILANAVEKYIDQLKFIPAKKDGEAIMFWVNIPFNFRMLP